MLNCFKFDEVIIFVDHMTVHLALYLHWINQRSVVLVPWTNHNLYEISNSERAWYKGNDRVLRTEPYRAARDIERDLRDDIGGELK